MSLAGTPRSVRTPRRVIISSSGDSTVPPPPPHQEALGPVSGNHYLEGTRHQHPVAWSPPPQLSQPPRGAGGVTTRVLNVNNAAQAPLAASLPAPAPGSSISALPSSHYQTPSQQRLQVHQPHSSSSSYHSTSFQLPQQPSSSAAPYRDPHNPPLTTTSRTPVAAPLSHSAGQPQSSLPSTAATSSRSSWTDNEHKKCLDALDALVHNTRRVHDDDAQSPTRRQHLLTTPNRDRRRRHEDVNDAETAESLFKRQEDHELHLISSALHSQDVVGLFSLLTVFWSTRNRLVREVETLQYRLGGTRLQSSSDNYDTSPSGGGMDHHHSDATPVVTAGTFEDAIQDAKQRLDAMCDALAHSASTPLLSSGASASLLKEREAALLWHQRVLQEGSFIDVIKLSVDIQQEYQKAQLALHDPFSMLLQPPPSTTQDDTSSSHRIRSAAAAAGGITPPAADFDYLDSLHAMVTSSLESQSGVKVELAALIAEYDASAHVSMAPPVLRLLADGGHHSNLGNTTTTATTVFHTSDSMINPLASAPVARTSEGGGGEGVDIDVALRLVPDFDEDVTDPLTAVGGASIALGRAGRQQQQRNDGGGGASDQIMCGLWRLVKFVSINCSAGETFLSILQRASAALGGSIDTPEQWNARHVFCPVNKRPLIDCVGMWLPPDPRLASTTGGAKAAGAYSGSNNLPGRPPSVVGPLLHGVVKDAMAVVVRVVVPLRSLAPAIRALMSQQHTIEHDTLPKLKQDVADAKQALWSAEIEAIEQRTAIATQPHRRQHGNTGALTAVQVKERLQRLEGHEALCLQALSQCQEHRRALEQGDLAALSAMLTASTSHIGVADGGDAIGGGGLAERIVFVCKELPRGSSLDEFAATFGVRADDLHVFEDLIVASSGSPAAAPAALAAWASAAGEHGHPQQQFSTTTQRRTLVYIPVRVPVANVVEQDRGLTQELDDYAREYPSFPPNAEVLDHLAALRRGDLNTLSALLTSARAKRKAFDESSRAGALQRRVDDLQHEVSRLLHDADELKEALRSSDALVREKAAALERLSWHQHNKPSAPPAAIRNVVGSVAFTSSDPRHDAFASIEDPAAAELGKDVASYNLHLSDWTPDACMQRGLSPAEALDQLTRIAERQEGTITNLRLMIKKCEEDKENTTKETILRLGSSTARLKQIKDLEATVGGLKLELRDESRRGSELTARLVQLEQLNEQQSKDLSTHQRALQASQEAHVTDRDELKDLRKSLREALARANTAERDAQRALEAQLSNATRHTFAAKEIPAGMKAAEFLRHLGVHGPVADIVLAKGAVYDELRQAHYLYVPVQVERGPWSVEDDILQSDMAKASAALAAADGEVQPSHAGGSRATHHHSDILDQLSALRSGDTVALSAMIRQYRSTIVALEEDAIHNNNRLMASSSLHDGLGASSLSPFSTGADSLREEDDLAWTTIKEGRAKVTLLRAALRHADAERAQWKTLCEEYQSEESDVQHRVATLEDAKRSAATRIDAVQSLLDAREKDIGRLKAQLVEAEEELRASDRRHLQQRQATDASHQEELEVLRASVAAEAQGRARDAQQLQEQLAQERHTVTALREALEEMGVEMVIDS